MSMNGVNGQNLQAIYENLTQLSKELKGTDAKPEETLFDKKDETVEDRFVSTTAKAEETTETASTVNILQGLVDTMTNMMSTIMSLFGTNQVAETAPAKQVQQISEAAPTASAKAADSVAEAEQVMATAQTSAKKEVKTMEEYMDILDAKFDELYEKFNGDTEQVQQYVKNNMINFADVDCNGRISIIDEMVWNEYFSVHSLQYRNRASGRYNQDVNKYGKEYNKMLTNIAHTLKNAITSKVSNTMYDFDDIENAIKVVQSSDKYSENSVLSKTKNKLNYAVMAQDENFEAKYEKLAEKLGKTSSGKKVLKELQDAHEYVLKNPDTAEYAMVASKYEKWIDEYENTNWKEKAQRIYDSCEETYKMLLKDKDTKKSYRNSQAKKDGVSFDEYCYSTAFYGYKRNATGRVNVNNIMNQIKEEFYKKGQAAGVTDLNGDKVVDAKDLALLKNNVNLNSDGKVSKDEINYLSQTKNKLSNNLYFQTLQSGFYNLNTIKDVISYCEQYETINKSGQATIDDAISSLKGVALHDILLHDHDNKFGNVDSLDTISSWVFSNNYSILTGHLFGDGAFVQMKEYMDGSSTNILPAEGSVIKKTIYGSAKTYSVQQALDALQNAADNLKPEITYLHYIQSADLTKEELQEILNKINACSTKVQTHLAQIKAVIISRINN